ncbi:general transcription factor II-I repeat domain-containing protein 2A [Trichonephila clavipes]|nr:general transcription factor II-I repeat domain-containing protein 2A [Trichonephila clavipes]
MFKYVSKKCHTSAASYSAANAIARHGKPFQEGEFLKEAWLACAPPLFDDFDNKDKIIQRIKDVPLSRDTMKDRILKLAENVTDQQKKMTLTPLLLYRYVLTKVLTLINRHV